MTASNSISGADKVPVSQKIAYGMGVVSDHYATVCLSIFFIPFFTDFLSLSATLVGATMALARVWDAFTDPFVGAWSDQCQSKYGRRKPFIFVGVIATGLCFPLIWQASPDWSDTVSTVFLIGVLLLFYTCYSFFSVPYESLGAELTPDYKERTNIFVVRTYVQQTFNLGIIWVFPLAAWLATFSWVGGEVGGVRLVGYLIGFVIILAGICPAIFCRERYRDIAKGQVRGRFLKELSELLKNRPLLIVIGVIATYLLAIISTMQLAYFVNVYYIYEGKLQEGTTLGGIDGTLRFAFSILGAIGIKYLSERVDKHHLLMMCVGILVVAFIGMYFTHIPGRPYLTLTMKPLLALGEVGFWVLVISMRADVCDWDEFRTGRRREGTISAAANWTIKLTISMAVLLGGVLLEHFVRFNTELEPGVLQEPGTMERLLICYTIPPIIALVICFIILMKYPLSRKKMLEIRASLEEQRGAAA